MCTLPNYWKPHRANFFFTKFGICIVVVNLIAFTKCFISMFWDYVISDTPEIEVVVSLLQPYQQI